MTFHAFLLGVSASLPLVATQVPAQPGPYLAPAATAVAGQPLPGSLQSTVQAGDDPVTTTSDPVLPAVYCSGKTGSTGCVPSIESSGTPSLTGADDFLVTSQQLPNNVIGTLVWGMVPATTPFAGGTLCIASPTLDSFGALFSGGNLGKATDCSGMLDFDVPQAFLNGQGLSAGTTVYMQFLVRDPGSAPPDNVVLSDAMSFVVEP